MNQKDYSLSHTFTQAEVDEFAQLSGDLNPIHVVRDYAISQGFETCIVHGVLVLSLISKVVGTKFPGDGTVIGSINWKYIKPIYVDSPVTVMFKLVNTDSERKKELKIQIMSNNQLLLQEGTLVVFSKI